MEITVHKSCLVCNSAGLKNLKGYETHGLVKCSSCGFVFMKRVPSQKELENYYSVYSYEQEREIPEPTRISLENLLNKFEKYRVSNKVLDVGCGEGWILELAKVRGWQVFGTEFSPRAIQICEKKGIKMYEGILDADSIEEKGFDIIISSETIEHINNPRTELKNIFQLLRVGGLFYLTTPNFNSYLRVLFKSKYDIIKYPEHLSYYTKRTLNKVLSISGFQKVKLLTTGASISHYRISKLTQDSSKQKNKSADENLRKAIAKSPALQLIKKIINWLLTFLGIGMTLKAFYQKR